MAVIKVDGEAIPAPDEGIDPADPLRTLRIELRLCQALAAFEPPSDLAVVLHGRIVAHLRALHRYHKTDSNARQSADLTDDELHQVTGIIRALRALPSLVINGPRPNSLAAVLGGYALEIADELTNRTEQGGQQ